MRNDIPRDFLDGLLGVDAASALLCAGGLDPGSQTIEDLEFWRLLRDNVGRTGDERHALGPNQVPEGSFALLLAAMRLATNFGQGLERLVGAAQIVRPDLGMSLRRDRGLLLGFAPEALRDIQSTLYVELIVVLLHCAGCWMTGSLFRPKAIVAAAASQSASGAVYALLGSPVVRRGSGVVVHYESDDGTRPLSSDHFDLWPTMVFEAYRQLTSAERPGTRSLGDTVHARLLSSRANQTTVADELGISVASLRRRLAAEGFRFREIEADVIRTFVGDAIATGRCFDDIATDLGYSEARSFRRAIRRWFGVSPSALRRSKSGE